MDGCIFSLAIASNDTIRAKIYIVNGSVRKRLLNAVIDAYGTGTAAMADLQSMQALRDTACGLNMPQEVVHLLYTYALLRHCPIPVRRGLVGSSRCVVCGSRSCWAVSTQDTRECVQCGVSEWWEEGGQCFQRLRNH